MDITLLFWLQSSQKKTYDKIILQKNAVLQRFICFFHCSHLWCVAMSFWICCNPYLLVPSLPLRPPCIAFSITSPYNIWVQNGRMSEKSPIKILKAAHSFSFVRIWRTTKFWSVLQTLSLSQHEVNLFLGFANGELKTWLLSRVRAHAYYTRVLCFLLSHLSQSDGNCSLPS